MGKELNLENNLTDKATSLFKTIASIIPIPIVNTIVAESIAYFIPNQRADRMKVFLLKLSDKLKYIEKDVLELKFKMEEYIDLFEDCLWASTRALTDERKEHIANVFKNGLKDDKTKIFNHKKLLQLLNQLDDLDILIIKYYSCKLNKNVSGMNKYKELIYSTNDIRSKNTREILIYRTKNIDSMGFIHYIKGIEENEDNILYGIPFYLCDLLLEEIN